MHVNELLDLSPMPNVIHRHYKGLVKEADATEFSTLTPANVKSEIVKFPTAKAA